MIRLTVKELLYKEGENWEEARKEELKNLIASIDLEVDDRLPVKKDGSLNNDGFSNFFFMRDFLIRFYSVESTDNSKYDLAIIEYFLEFSFNDPEELRYWFHDAPKGNSILKTSWSEEDPDGETYLQFESFEEVK